MRVIRDFDLTTHNTFGLAARAGVGAILTSDADIAAFAAFAAEAALPLKIIGGGSNLLLRDEIPGAVALIATHGRSIVAQEPDRVLVQAKAGESWPDFVAWTVAQGLGGLENLAGIPGTVGAAPVQNIGAYGLELQDRFVSLTAYDVAEGRSLTLRREDCRFGYRHSLFKETDRFIILDVTLALPRPWRARTAYTGLEHLPADADPAAVMERVLALRGQKLPDWRILGNAGSFFENPIVPLSVAHHIPDAPRFALGPDMVKLSAAWLIEASGLKGAREGQAGVHQGHALIIVNHGGATFSEVERLAQRIRGAIFERFGIALKQEPVVM